MAATSSTGRITAWNILIFDNTIKRTPVGAYQSIDVPFLTWKDLFDDLLLCLLLEPYITAPDAALALYLLHEKDVLAHTLDTPFLSYNSNKPGSEEQLSQLIKLTVLNGPEGPNPPTLPVSLILHDYAHCKDIQC